MKRKAENGTAIYEDWRFLQRWSCKVLFSGIWRGVVPSSQPTFRINTSLPFPELTSKSSKKTDMKQVASEAWWRRNVPPKHRLNLTGLHGLISQCQSCLQFHKIARKVHCLCIWCVSDFQVHVEHLPIWDHYSWTFRCDKSSIIVLHVWILL
jgi:hypothetical protein